MHTHQNRALVRWGTAAVIAGILALGAAGCADPSLTAKSLEQGAAAEQSQEAPAPQSGKGKATSPLFGVAIDTSLALERYAYQTSKGAGTCYNNQPDRPPYTIEAGAVGEFCLHPSDPLKSVDAVIDVTYRIVDDPQGRTLWIKGVGPQIGENTIACEVRKADMKTRDDSSPYQCSTEWRGDVKSYDPKPQVLLREAGTPAG